MLGLYDAKNNKIQHLLCRVGKFGNLNVKDPDYVMNMQFLCNALFFSNKARLADEGIWREKIGGKPISYQAYDITYEQYLEFVQVLESLQTPENEFGCYKPDILEDSKESQNTDDGNDEEVTLTYTIEKLFLPVDVSEIEQSVSGLSVHNTCRHSAIELVEKVQHGVGSLVSSNFINDLPYETCLIYGKPSEDIPFYVLPAPPTAFVQLDEIKAKVISKLYTRMENMLRLEPDSPQTQKKFLRLKELYLDIVGPQKDSSLESLIQNIKEWKATNTSDLEVLRKTYFWDYLPFFKRTSSTMKLIKEVEHDLEVEIDNRPHG